MKRPTSDGKVQQQQQQQQEQQQQQQTTNNKQQTTNNNQQPTTNNQQQQQQQCGSCLPKTSASNNMEIQPMNKVWRAQLAVVNRNHHPKLTDMNWYEPQYDNAFKTWVAG